MKQARSLCTVLQSGRAGTHPLAKPARPPAAPGLRLFLGGAHFSQVSLIIFSLLARNKPCYPLCLEHPPTSQAVLLCLSASVSKPFPFRGVYALS